MNHKCKLIPKTFMISILIHSYLQYIYELRLEFFGENKIITYNKCYKNINHYNNYVEKKERKHSQRYVQ